MILETNIFTGSEYTVLLRAFRRSFAWRYNSSKKRKVL